jgi:hypothetical protein
MALPSKDIFQSIIETALVEADLIALKAKSNPSEYIRPEIGKWGAMYVSSRYNFIYNTDDRGKIDLMEQDALSQLRADAHGVDVAPPTLAELNLVGPGSGVAAVGFLIELLRAQFGAAQVSEMYQVYAGAVMNKDSGAVQAAFLALFRGALLGFMKLYNTMLATIGNQEKPKPVPGPGQHLTQDPYGNWVVRNDVVVTDDKLLGTITVGQFKKIMGIRTLAE